jgi:hypothetical protein
VTFHLVFSTSVVNPASWDHIVYPRGEIGAKTLEIFWFPMEFCSWVVPKLDPRI